MAVIKGFPGTQRELTSAVRKALFTSAAVAAVTVGTPGYNAYAQQVGACTPSAIEFTNGAVQCSGAFDEAIEYNVKDMTVVDEVSGESSTVVGDINVVVAEGSTATGIHITSVTAAQGAASAEGSIVIENHGDVTVSGENGINIDPSFVKTYYDRDLRFAGEPQSGVVYSGMVRLNPDGTVIAGTEVDFGEEGIGSQEMGDYLAAQGINVPGSVAWVDGRSDFSIIVAPAGSLQFDDVAAISAETESGDIEVNNTGDITIGSGISLNYYTSVSLSGGALSRDIDTDGDGKVDLKIYGDSAQVFVSNNAIKTTRAAVVGIDTISIGGDISVANAGDIMAGDVSYGIRSHTDLGDISISNSGDIALGADSVGIQATTAIALDLVYEHSYVDGENVLTGQLVTRPDRVVKYYHTTTTLGEKFFNVDGADNSIQIANSGNISVGAGSTGILAHNPSGDEIVIQNSGDITVGTGEGGSGIYASAMAGFETQYLVTTEKSDPYIIAKDGNHPNSVNGPYGGRAYYGAFYGATAKIRHYSVSVNKEGRAYVEDVGDITIVNSGTIDISAATDARAIFANTLGKTAIQNDGTIFVGANSLGIATAGAGETLVINSGDIQIDGRASNGISVRTYINHQLIGNSSIGGEEIYGGLGHEALNDAYAGFGGDTNVYNTGSITGNSVASEVVNYNEAGAVIDNLYLPFSRGIMVAATNSNLKGTDVPFAMYGPDAVASLNERPRDKPIVYRDEIEFYTTTVINTGDIAMGDLSEGIRVSATYGESIIYNTGTVSVGNGVLATKSGSYSAVTAHARGLAGDAGGDDWAHSTVINGAEGLVITGNITKGMTANSSKGSAMVINDGTVIVGNGATLAADGVHRVDDVTVNSVGLEATTILGIDVYAGVANNGSLTTGDNSIGMVASGTTGTVWFTDAFEHDFAAAVMNAGTLTTGDNSLGMAVAGVSSFGYNSGDITIGSGDFVSGTTATGSAAMKSLRGVTGSLHSILLNQGSITTGDDTMGIDAGGFSLAVAAQGEKGTIVTGNDTIGMNAVGYYQSATQNYGSVRTGDNSIGLRGYAITAAVMNSGDVVVGDNSIGIQNTGAFAYVINTGTVSTGADSIAVSVYSAGASGVVINSGNINSNGVAIEMHGEAGSIIQNGGTIRGSIVTGDGDDFLNNNFRYDADGYLVGAGKLVLDDAIIDMGAGVNVFSNSAGDIVFSGDSRIDLGARGAMLNYSGGANYVTISSVDGNVGDTLTIDGDVRFNTVWNNNGLLLVDVGSKGSDSIVINGNLTVDETDARGTNKQSSLRVAMNVTDQAKGAMTTGPILSVSGEQDMSSLLLGGIAGDFGNTVLSAQLRQSDNGDWVIDYTAGLSDLGAAASSVSHLAESFWLRSAYAFFDSERAANGSETGRSEGLHAWSSVFRSSSDMEVEGDVAAQNLAFSQALGGHVAGATYSTKLAGSWLSVSPMVGLGTADGNQLEQSSTAKLDTKTYGVTGSWSMSDFYANAMYQVVDFDANLRADDSAAFTSGQAQGFSLEAGWTYLSESGVAMTPFAQWDDVKVEIDDFTSSDGAFDYAYDIGNSKRARLGLNLRKSFSIREGFAMPYATFSVVNQVTNDTHDLHSNGVVFTSDASGSGFNVDFGIDGKYKLWTFKTGVGMHGGDTDNNGVSGHLGVSRSL